jgi:S-formylglutathione hydrolase
MKTSPLLRPQRILLNHYPIKPLPLTIHTRTTKMPFETKATIKTFGGHLLKLSHPSPSPHSPSASTSNTTPGSTTGTPMAVNLFLPPQSTTQKVPVLFYLSGLTCTPDNCSEKGFLQRHASLHGLAIVYPDTSPRGANIAGEDDSWDFGTGAGFYVDATREPWKQHYRMESYITRELPAALWEAFPEKLDKERVSITGHSMGGHGALTLFLKHPGLYKSVSAFAPIANPINCPWGQKAFGGYLGEDREEWKKHDATELLKAWKGGKFQALVDVGTGDNFYKQGQLLPENLEAAAKEVGAEVEVRYQPVSFFFLGRWQGEGMGLMSNRSMIIAITSSRLSARIMWRTMPSSWGNSRCSKHAGVIAGRRLTGSRIVER